MDTRKEAEKLLAEIEKSSAATPSVLDDIKELDAARTAQWRESAKKELEKPAIFRRHLERYQEVETALMALTEKYDEDLAALRQLPSSEEVSVQIIDRVMAYCVSHEGVMMCEDVPMDHNVVNEMIAEKLLEMLTYFLTDAHRIAMVRYHAQGLTTAAAVSALVEVDPVINKLANAMNWQELRPELIHRFAYLKPGSGRWPEKKYGDVWRESRAAYQAELRDIPLSSTAEQVKVLSEHVQQVMGELTKELPFKTYIPLMNTLVKLVNSLHKLTGASRPHPKMPEVLIMLPTAEQLSLLPPEQRALLGDPDAFLSRLEQSLSERSCPEQTATDANE